MGRKMVQEPTPLWFETRVVALVVLCFLPYAAVALGNNTNVPLSSLLALTFFPMILRDQRLVLTLGLVLLGPFVQSLALTLLGVEVNLAAAVAWILHAAPLLGFAAIAGYRPDALVKPLYWALLSSCLYAVLQLAFIRRGQVPLVDLYEIPGYASVKNQESIIVNYIRRPFGWFPEPSFLAGTLALGAIVYLMLRTAHGRRLAPGDFWMLGAVVGTIFLTRSGSGVLTISAIFLVAVVPYRRSAWLLPALSVLGLVGVKFGWDILSSRSGSGQNFSWTDRLTSLVAAGQYVYNSGAGWLVGIGKGSLNQRFVSGDILAGSAGGRLLDTASVLLRLVYELGLPLGGLLLGILVMAVVRGSTALVGGTGAAIILFTWMVVAGVTITYDSAALIWAVPGIALGVSVRGTLTNASKPRERMPR